MLLKIQTKPKSHLILVEKDANCSVFKTDAVEVVLVGQIFNDVQNYQNPAQYFYETVIKQPIQKVDDIDGYYGVIMLDKTIASVEVFRDPIGMQPLYYAFQNEEILFSSTLKGLNEAVPNAAPCEAFFLKYLEEFVPNTYELTMYEGILRIAPNSHYIFKEGKQTEKRTLFDFKKVPIQNRTDTEAIKMFQGKLEKAVGKHIKGQKDLFFQYTGGLDSTGILSVARFLRGNMVPKLHQAERMTEGFHTYIHQYMPDHQSFDEMHIVKKLHQTEGLPLPHYTPETHFETLEEEIAYGKANHTLMIINQVLDNIYIDMKDKKGKLLFSGFGGDEGLTFNQAPNFLINQIKDLRLDKMLKSIQIYGFKRYVSQLIKIDLRVFLLKKIFPHKIIIDHFNLKNGSESHDNRRYIYDTHGYISYLIKKPHVAYRIEEEKEMAAVHGVLLAYPLLDFQLLRYFLSLKENQIIYQKKGRFFYKNALRKYIQSDWYFKYTKANSVTYAEPTFKDDKELDAQLTYQYEKLPHFIKQYKFRVRLLKQHKLVKEILLGRLSKIVIWLSTP